MERKKVLRYGDGRKRNYMVLDYLIVSYAYGSSDIANYVNLFHHHFMTSFWTSRFMVHIFVYVQERII